MKAKLNSLPEQIAALAEMPINDFMQFVQILQKFEPIIQEMATLKEQIKSLPALERAEITILYKGTEKKMRDLQKAMENLEF